MSVCVCNLSGYMACGHKEYRKMFTTPQKLNEMNPDYQHPSQIDHKKNALEDILPVEMPALPPQFTPIDKSDQIIELLEEILNELKKQR